MTMTAGKEHELTNRWAKVTRYVKLLSGEMGATRAEVALFGPTDWEVVDRLDFAREGRAKFRPSSADTRAAVLARMPEVGRHHQTPDEEAAEAAALLEAM